MTAAFDVEDLRRFVETGRAASYAAAHLRECEKAPIATTEPLYQTALKAARAHHASMLMLDLDPVFPDPRAEKEVWRQIDAANLRPPIKPKKRLKVA